MTHSGARVPKRATYADIEALPDHLVGEILDGELHASPRPGLRHAVAATRLTGRLSPPFDDGLGGPGGWWILIEPELHLGEDIVVPDLAGWRRERLPEIPDAPHLELAPDWGLRDPFALDGAPRPRAETPHLRARESPTRLAH